MRQICAKLSLNTFFNMSNFLFVLQHSYIHFGALLKIDRCFEIHQSHTAGNITWSAPLYFPFKLIFKLSEDRVSSENGSFKMQVWKALQKILKHRDMGQNMKLVDFTHLQELCNKVPKSRRETCFQEAKFFGHHTLNVNKVKFFVEQKHPIGINLSIFVAIKTPILTKKFTITTRLFPHTSSWIDLTIWQKHQRSECSKEQHEGFVSQMVKVNQFPFDLSYISPLMNFYKTVASTSEGNTEKGHYQRKSSS